MSDLDKAREWAESLAAGPATDRAHAAAKVIQSLPDQLVDAEEVQKVLVRMREDSLFEESLRPHVNALERLLTPKSSINPEDVPPNEPWLIEVAGGKAIGTRFAGDSFAPWSVAALDGSFAGDDSDSDVTLIHKLVPEPPALPEGMRLADHEEYGRVVVSPETDQDDDYLAFYSDKNIEYGGSWAYPKEYELTFLGGADNG